MSETDYSFVTEIRVQLARIEKKLKLPLSALAVTLDNVKETAKDAKRKAEEALRIFDKQADARNEFKLAPFMVCRLQDLFKRYLGPYGL